MSGSTVAVVDIDGTLIDSNYQHALAWYRALRLVGETYPVWRLHRLIGMGGDQVLTAVGGEDLERRVGDQAREQQGKEVDALLEEMAPLPGARDLLVAVKERGHRLVLASSAQRRHVDVFLDKLDARGIADDWTSSADVETSKPAPDLLQVALKKLGAPPDASSVMVGDSVWDVEAAKRAGMPAIVVRSGGFGDDELQKAGAIAIYDTPGDLAKALDDTPLAGRRWPRRRCGKASAAIPQGSTATDDRQRDRPGYGDEEHSSRGAGRGGERCACRQPFPSCAPPRPRGWASSIAVRSAPCACWRWTLCRRPAMATPAPR